MLNFLFGLLWLKKRIDLFISVPCRMDKAVLCSFLKCFMRGEKGKISSRLCTVIQQQKETFKSIVPHGKINHFLPWQAFGLQCWVNDFLLRRWLLPIWFFSNGLIAGDGQTFPFLCLHSLPQPGPYGFFFCFISDDCVINAQLALMEYSKLGRGILNQV